MEREAGYKEQQVSSSSVIVLANVSSWCSSAVQKPDWKSTVPSIVDPKDRLHWPISIRVQYPRNSRPVFASFPLSYLHCIAHRER